MGDLPDWTRAVAVEVNAEAPTEYWLAKNGTRIVEDDTVVGGTTTLYTVPAGSVLYVLFAGLTVYPGSSTGEAYLFEANAARRKILYDNYQVKGVQRPIASKVFYRAIETEDIKLYGDAGITAWGYFHGYLMEEE